MTQVMSKCPDCDGAGTVPHVPRSLAEDEIADPNSLDRYKILDTCEPCGGRGERLVEINLGESAG